MKFRQLVFPLTISFFLFACATPSIIPVNIPQPALKREHKLQELSNWNLRGKVSFITEEDRNSANIFWLKQQDNQTIKITSTLGINLFSAQSSAQSHSVTVDGKIFHGRDLDHLIRDVTGYQLPVGALENWLKAIHDSPQDNFTYDSQTQLPKTLSTFYMNDQWLVEYQRFGMQENVALPYNIKISRKGLTLLIKVYRWEIL